MKGSYLEIIHPQGEITFVAVDGEGVLNIGKHPENHIVLRSDGVADFQALIDCRGGAALVIPLSDEPALLVNGHPVHAPTPLPMWDTLQVGGYTLMLISSEVDGAPTLEKSPVAQSAAPADAQRLTRAPTAEHDDDIVLTEVPVREWVVDCDQPAVCTVHIVNGGPLVATFETRVEGLDLSWVQIEPPQINLNEGARGSVTITICAPRAPSSRAGVYEFSVVTTSDEHPERYSARACRLTLKPFYDFLVGDVTPRNQRISYFKQSGAVTLSILNRGNAPTQFQISGEDDENACRLEFSTLGDNGELNPLVAKQISVSVPPDGALDVFGYITPVRRRLIALAHQPHNLTFTVNILDSPQAPRSLFAQARSLPLIGPGLLMLFAVMLAAFIVWVFRPQVYQLEADPQVLMAGEEVTLLWAASPFTNVRIESNQIQTGDDGLGNQAITAETYTLFSKSGALRVRPKSNLVYRLVGNNILGQFLPFLAPAPIEREVIVNPLRPVVRAFKSDRAALLIGESANLSWDVINADEVTLITNGAPETLPAEQRRAGQRRVTLDVPGAGVFEIVARNRYGEDRKNVRVVVAQATPTPPPPPVIVQFDVQPQVITAGQSVQLRWEVNNAERVEIAPVVGANVYPPKGTLEQQPSRSTSYVLVAFNGNRQTTLQRDVIVLPAPPTPVPPSIRFFTASPQEVVIGSPQARAVRLSWQITGDTTDVTLSGPDIGNLRGLPREGAIEVGVSSTTLFVLSAANGDFVTSQQVNVRALEPTPTLPPPPTPAPTPTPFPPPRIVYFIAQDINGNALLQNGPTSYQVPWNTNVRLLWEVEGASTQVQLFRAGAPLGVQPPSGVRQPENISGAVQFLLQAENPGGLVSTVIQFTVLPKPVPPTPTNVNVSGGNPLVVSWSYPSAARSEIIGFRVYRALQGSSTYTLVQSDVQNGGSLDPNASSWNDPILPDCGWSYRVAAAYIDENGQTQETPLSDPPFNTAPCPTPTPP